MAQAAHQAISMMPLTNKKVHRSTVSGRVNGLSVESIMYVVGPGLVQLVERLTHRYSESKSSNPGNLTSATVCGDRTGGVVTKRSACVAPEVDLRECTLHSPPQKIE